MLIMRVLWALRACPLLLVHASLICRGRWCIKGVLDAVTGTPSTRHIWIGSAAPLGGCLRTLSPMSSSRPLSIPLVLRYRLRYRSTNRQDLLCAHDLRCVPGDMQCCARRCGCSYRSGDPGDSYFFLSFLSFCRLLG
jgi:hypothetical protein